MTDHRPPGLWGRGSAYERYVGRWSRLVAPQFIAWLGLPPGKRWLDVGCGTGALSQTLRQMADPALVIGIDRSEGFAASAHEHVPVAVSDAQALPIRSKLFDAAISGLVLNFVPKAELAVAGMARAVIPGGTVAAYIWDYAGKMQFMRHFWNAAAALNPKVLEMDEGRRCQICNPQALTQLFQDAGLTNVETRPIDIDTHFADFDDF
jgi:ubiquinone/menaquinone biosynthesis C-methylase UbiE